MSKTAYIAGPMRGIKDFNFPAFDAVAKAARRNGYTIFSPAEHDRESGFDETQNDLEGFDLKAALRWDIEAILKSDEILLLPNWRASSGVAIELVVARAIGIPVYEVFREDDWLGFIFKLLPEEIGAKRSISEWQVDSLATATASGFHDEPYSDDPESVALSFMLINGEVNEAFEEVRDGHELTETYYRPENLAKPEGVPSELADAVIRIMDFCGKHGINLEEAIETKAAYNKTREFRHGKQF